MGRAKGIPYRKMTLRVPEDKHRLVLEFCRQEGETQTAFAERMFLVGLQWYSEQEEHEWERRTANIALRSKQQ